MNRRDFLLAAFAAAPFAVPQAARRRPNIVFLLADDLGAHDLSVYGADLHETPRLDRFAAESVRFTRAYAASPVCTPTRASILTGKHPARLRMTIWREAAQKPPLNRRVIPPLVEPNLPLEETTLAETLHAAGYLTAHIGKWHLGDAEHFPENQGFDVNIGGSVWGAPQTFFYPYRGNRLYGGEPRYVPGLHGGKPGEYLTDRLTTEAIRIMESAGDRPFFLNLWYHTVHTPIEGKPEHVDRYRARLGPGLHHRNPQYAAMVRSLDENVGRVLDALRRLGLEKNTIVVFFSDNGGFIGKYQGEAVTDNYPLRSGKGAVYEGGIRVPLVVRAPGWTRPGGVCHEPVSSLDLRATLEEWAGVRAPDAPRDTDGMSLAPLLRNPSARLAREELFWHYPHYYETTTPAGAIAARDLKLIEYFEDNRVELYDLKADPSESRNLAAERPADAARLRERLRQWREEVKAPMPSPNPKFRPRP